MSTKKSSFQSTELQIIFFNPRVCARYIKNKINTNDTPLYLPLMSVFVRYFTHKKNTELYYCFRGRVHYAMMLPWETVLTGYHHGD